MNSTIAITAAFGRGKLTICNSYCAMKIAVQPFIFGASCFYLIRTGLANIASSTCTSTESHMSTSTTADLPAADYVSGTSSVAFITTPDEASAKKLAHSLVEKRLSACVNIVPKIMSIYVWEGKVLEDNECMLIVKTRTCRVNDLTKFVRDNHPYSVAEVISMPIENGNAPYMDWIHRTVADSE